MGLAGIGGFIAVSLFWILSGPLFLIGAVFEFVSRRRARHGPQEPPALPA